MWHALLESAMEQFSPVLCLIKLKGAQKSVHLSHWHPCCTTEEAAFPAKDPGRSTRCLTREIGLNRRQWERGLYSETRSGHCEPVATLPLEARQWQVSCVDQVNYSGDSQRGSQTRSIHIPWEQVRNAKSQAPLLPIRNCILRGPHLRPLF